MRNKGEYWINKIEKAEQAESLKRKRTKRLYSIISLIVLAALVLFTYFFVQDRIIKDRAGSDLNGPYKVERIVDGDTIVVKMRGESVKVRMIGIDTPESVAPSYYDKENTPQGLDASEYTKKLLEGKKVYLEYDVNYEDQYGRVLAYVYLKDAKTMVQMKLLEEGLASVYTVQPNSKYAEDFLRIQQEARSNGKGFWGTGYYQ